MAKIDWFLRLLAIRDQARADGVKAGSANLGSIAAVLLERNGTPKQSRGAAPDLPHLQAENAALREMLAAALGKIKA